MKMVRKILLVVGIVIVAVILGAVVAFSLFGETAIRKTVESQASKTLGVPVTVKGIDLSLLSGKVGIRGLVVQNPPGYQNPTLLELGEGQVQVDIGSLMSDTVKVKLIKLDGAKMTMEQKGLTNNLKEILDRLPKSEEKAQPEPGQKKLVVNHLEITNTNVKVKLIPVPGKSDTVSINIDPIVMDNLGADSKIDIGILSGKILAAIATGVAKQAVGLLPDDMVAGIGSALGKTAELGKAATQQGQKILETTTGAGKGAVDGLKGLLGGKKKKD